MTRDESPSVYRFLSKTAGTTIDRAQGPKTAYGRCWDATTLSDRMGSEPVYPVFPSLPSSPAMAFVNRPSVMDSGSGIDSIGRFVPGSREMRPDKT